MAKEFWTIFNKPSARIYELISKIWEKKTWKTQKNGKILKNLTKKLKNKKKYRYKRRQKFATDHATK